MASRTGALEPNETSPARIECHTDLRAFFHETLTRALASRQVDVPQPTEHYLVTLLAFLGHDSAPLSRSLVELSLAAQQGSRAGRLEKQPDLELDSARTSPRVLEALEEAKRTRVSSKP